MNAAERHELLASVNSALANVTDRYTVHWDDAAQCVFVRSALRSRGSSDTRLTEALREIRDASGRYRNPGMDAISRKPRSRCCRSWFRERSRVSKRLVTALDCFIEERFVGSRTAWLLSLPFAALGWFLASGSGPYE